MYEPLNNLKFSSEQFRKLYKWSLKLDGKSELKIALDHVMCSICFSKPWLFVYLMTRMQGEYSKGIVHLFL